MRCGLTPTRLTPLEARVAASDAPAAAVQVAGVRFRRAGRLYYYNPGGADLRAGDYAIVETPRGLTAARVVMAPTAVDPADLHGEVTPIVRQATDDDLDSMTNYRDQEVEAERVFSQAITERRLPMQAVKAEYTFDGATLTLHFSSKEAKLDLTELVAAMAAQFHTRVMLRQVGPRERAALRSGLGRCGRELCCATFLSELDTVSLRMAKDQNLPLNPDKISGVCGRLLCCLQYEHDGYVEDKLAAAKANGGGSCATSGACGACGVHELKDALGQPVAPGYEQPDARTAEDGQEAASHPSLPHGKDADRAAGAGSGDVDRAARAEDTEGGASADGAAGGRGAASGTSRSRGRGRRRGNRGSRSRRSTAARGGRERGTGGGRSSSPTTRSRRAGTDGQTPRRSGGRGGADRSAPAADGASGGRQPNRRSRRRRPRGPANPSQT